MRSYHSQLNTDVSIENMKKLIQYFVCFSIVFMATFGCVNIMNSINVGIIEKQFNKENLNAKEIQFY
jgi:hypothetical protein